jgi:hypothetical protein
LVFAWELDTLDFSVNRDMNAHAYYPAWNRLESRFIACIGCPETGCPFIRSQTTSGAVACDGLVKCQKSLSIKVWDVHGQCGSKGVECGLEISGVGFNCSGFSERSLQSCTIEAFPTWSARMKGSIEVHCPPRAFYHDFSLEVLETDVSSFQIGTSEIPVSKPLEVRINRLECSAKTAVCSVADDGSRGGCYTGECRNGSFVFTTRELGKYEWAGGFCSAAYFGTPTAPHKRGFRAGRKKHGGITIQSFRRRLGHFQLQGHIGWEMDFDALGSQA